MRSLKEHDLQLFWKNSNLTGRKLKTTRGEDLIIINPGEWNQNSGPDFFNAEILIDGFRFHGNVEIHTKTSKFLEHGHQFDPSYKNILLHVVFEDDIDLNARFSTLELCKYITAANLRSSRKNSKDEILYDHFLQLEKSKVKKLAFRRLNNRIRKVEFWHKQSKGDWQEVFYKSLCIGMGLNVNSMAFENLSHVLPYSVIRRHRNDITDIEALVFGQSGFLNNDSNDAYQNILKRRFEILKLKYSLIPMSKASWKFMRMRPMNFPSIRLAQLSKMLFEQPNLFSSCLELKGRFPSKSEFACGVSEYWKSHYMFARESRLSEKIPGKKVIEGIRINSIMPYSSAFSKIHGNKHYALQAVSILESLPPERNRHTERIKTLGGKLENAMQSQALLQLKTEMKI